MTGKQAIEKVKEARQKHEIPNFSGADLIGANLIGANLIGADLIGANLSGADLSEADLSRVNLGGADLIGANLIGANLIGANLSGADLSGADLSWVNLGGANLIGANLIGANLIGANLSGANLSGADFNKTVLDPRNMPNQIEANKFRGKGNWLIGYRTRETSAAGGVLVDDRIYGCEVFSTCETECHPGWYLWPTLEESKKFSGSNKEFIKVKTRRVDLHKAGSKWRTRTIWVIGTVEEVKNE